MGDGGRGKKGGRAWVGVGGCGGEKIGVELKSAITVDVPNIQYASFM